MELISEDALHMRTLSATLLSIRRRRNANLQEFCKSLIDLYATAKGDTLVGNVFASQEEFAAWFKFAQDFVGTERASMPEGSNCADLEELASLVSCITRFLHHSFLASLVSRIESSPVARPSSFAVHPCLPTPPHLLIPPIAADSPVVQASHNSGEDEDDVMDQLAGDYN